MAGMGWGEILIVVLIGVLPIVVLIWIVRNFIGRK